MSICKEDFCGKHNKRFRAGEKCPDCAVAINSTNNEIERLLIKHHDACAKVRSHPKPCLSDPTLKSPQYWREDVVIAAMTELKYSHR